MDEWGGIFDFVSGVFDVVGWVCEFACDLASDWGGGSAETRRQDPPPPNRPLW